MTKNEIKKREAELIDLCTAFCDEKLNENYARLCVKLIKKMGRKREVPFKRGNIEIWAAAVVYALGSINFLFDKASQPYILATDISNYFGTKNPSVSNKAREIKDMFGMVIYDDEFATDQMNANDPFIDLVVVDGLIMKLSLLPEEIQKLVKSDRDAGRDVELSTADAPEE